MSKIIHIVFSMEVGGTENMLTDLVNEQAAFSQVSLIVVNRCYDKQLLERISPRVRLILVDRQKGIWNPLLLLKIWQCLNLFKPDIIHCHQHNMIHLLPFWHKKAVITIHTVGVSIKNLKKYKKVYAISKAVQQDLLSRGNIKATVVLNGIKANSIQNKNKRIFAITPIYKILQVGRLYHETKGQHLAIEALKTLQKNSHPQIQLYFIGKGPSLKYLKEQTAALKLHKSVFFLGEKQRGWIYENLQQFDLLLQPSLYEGFGLTILEGLAAGLPVIASNVDGPAEILKDIPAGFLFDLSEKDALATTIQRVMNLALQNKMDDLCSQSKQLVQERYSISQTAFKYIETYPALRRTSLAIR